MVVQMITVRITFAPPSSPVPKCIANPGCISNPGCFTRRRRNATIPETSSATSPVQNNVNVDDNYNSTTVQKFVEEDTVGNNEHNTGAEMWAKAALYIENVCFVLFFILQIVLGIWIVLYYLIGY